jgi:O-antigen/teichoic acid export membrane protein
VTAPVTAASRPTPELRPPSLRKNFAWTMAGNGTYFACQAGWLMVLAKLGGPAMVGRFAIGLAVCAPVVMFTRLQLRDIQATDARDEYRFGDYLSLRLTSVAVGSGVIAAIALLSGYTRPDVLTMLAIAAFRAVEGVSDVVYGLLQKWERFDLVSRSLMIKGPASVVALGSVFYLTGSLALGAVGIAAAWMGLLLLYDARNARRLMRVHQLTEDLRPGSLWSRGRVRAAGRLVWLALPLGFVALLDSLNQNVPRYAIQHYLGNEQLGFFAVMAYVVVAGNMVVSALANSAQPRLSRRYLHNIGAFRRLVWKLVQFGLALGAVAVIMVILLGRPFLAVFYTPEFAEHADAFVWIMLAAGVGFVARFLVYSMTAARYLRAQAPLYAAVLAVVAALSWRLVPAHGLNGAAWASCAGMLVLVLGAGAVNLHAVRARPGAAVAEQPLPGPSADLL